MAVQSDAKPVSLEPKTSETHLSPSYEIKHWEKITIAQPLKGHQQFIEREELLLTSLEYPRNGKNPGLVLIFNQESFDDKKLDNRVGSRRDVNEIIICMSRLGFNIHEEHIFNDFTKDDVLGVVQKLVKEDLSQVNSLIVFFLTHGESFNKLHAHDDSLKTNELWKNFVDCADLKNKPKMFIFQACKGNDFSTIADDTDQKIVLVPDSTFSSDYIGPDMLIVYSTSEGKISFRDPKTGTWFIQELCKNFTAYGRRDDVISLIMRTTKCLCRNYYHHEKDVIKKQMPVFVSTLRKKFYLNRSKDRNILIKLVQDQEAMKETIKDLQDKVNVLLQENKDRRGK